MIVMTDLDMRKFPRREYTVPVEVHDHVRGKRAIAQALDINPFGMFLQTRASMAVGEILTLHFASPEGGYELCISGQVVRTGGRGGGVGVEFFDVDDWIFEELCGYVYEQDEPRSLRANVLPSTALP